MSDAILPPHRSTSRRFCLFPGQALIVLALFLAVFGVVFLVEGVGALPAKAADLDRYKTPRMETTPHESAGPSLDPNCRLIPQPQLDLYGYVRFFRPTIVCFSSGLLADSFHRW
ncbi:hypothetical protein [Beijerinckia indica]|uniref:Transmembrane protein n=1 Tax=Beijerinckia indica subsp. indica (strain ATCC 9039 / DSM 1715 / NCIMB 8712) TaxID=395963 RepID=B2IBN1_BEII9|nr:hypothetical protein [Beijerinckia indica]ACB93753.1 hypothetical protein Bind_0094 [Beijerinckia indica subsp. indica ATCC 9039]